MHGGRFRRSSQGFTIIETLIVLAVTMAMFLSATYLIDGKQRSTAFNQSIRAIQNEFQQTVSTVSSGNYESDGTVKCAKGGNGPVLSSGGSDNQGTNQDCIFLGKVMQFNVGNTDPQAYNTYTLVGIRSTSDSNVFDLGTSKARLIARASGEESSAIPATAFTAGKLQYGLAAVSMRYYDAGGTGHDTTAVGFGSNLASLGDGDNSQPINLIAVPNTGTVEKGLSAGEGVLRVNQNLAAAVVNPASIRICFASGGTDQSGLITLGGNNRQDSVTLQIYSNGTCR